MAWYANKIKEVREILVIPSDGGTEHHAVNDLIQQGWIVMTVAKPKHEEPSLLFALGRLV